MLDESKIWITECTGKAIRLSEIVKYEIIETGKEDDHLHLTTKDGDIIFGLVPCFLDLDIYKFYTLIEEYYDRNITKTNLFISIAPLSHIFEWRKKP